jgi:ferritin
MSRFSTKHQQTVTEKFPGIDGVLKNTASDEAHGTKSLKKMSKYVADLNNHRLLQLYSLSINMG